MSVQDRDDFLRRLDENEDDESTRLIYADWLEENGEDDEADRQRRWTAAKKWLMDLHQRGSGRWDDEDEPPDEDGDGWYCMTFPRMMKEAARAAADGSYSFNCGASEGVQDELNSNRAAFWRNWSIVSGTPVPPDVEDQAYFSCSC